jgi:hypothetical protein
MPAMLTWELSMLTPMSTWDISCQHGIFFKRPCWEKNAMLTWDVPCWLPCQHGTSHVNMAFFSKCHVDMRCPCQHGAPFPDGRRKGTCSPVPGGRLDQSRSCFARDPSFARPPMLTGAPNKGRGRSAQLASELKAKGR